MIASGTAWIVGVCIVAAIVIGMAVHRDNERRRLFRDMRRHYKDSHR
jgi:hypothetical protein